MDEQGTPGDELTLTPTTIVTRRRPKALWGVLAAVAVAAGALAVTSAGDDAVAPPLPIALGSAGGSGATEPALADAAMGWLTYVPGDDLSALGGEAPAYRLTGVVDEAQVQALADALGVSGAVVHQGGMWTVTSIDGATLQVEEGAAGTWWYSAVSPDVSIGRSSSGVDGCVETSTEDGSVTSCGSMSEECPPDGACPAVELPAPPDCAKVEADDCVDVFEPAADLPSKDEARDAALDVLAATGMSTDDAVVTVDGPYDTWSVTVEPRVDGTPSGLLSSVSVGPKGVITYAYGYLATPERLGTYPILDTTAAIARLNEQPMMAGFAYRGGVAMDTDVLSAGSAVAPTTTVASCAAPADGSEICLQVATAGPDCVNPPVPGSAVTDLKCELPPCPDLVAPADLPLSDDQIVECPIGDPGPVPDPDPVEIVLTEATATLVLVPANDGTTDAYLVPGYRFRGDDGVRVDAPAIVDAALTGPPPTEPPVTGTVTTDTLVVPDPGGTGGGTPPSGCEPLVEEDGSGTTMTVQPCAGIDPTDPDVTTTVPDTTTSLVTEE